MIRALLYPPIRDGEDSLSSIMIDKPFKSIKIPILKELGVKSIKEPIPIEHFIKDEIDMDVLEYKRHSRSKNNDYTWRYIRENNV